MRDSDQHPEGPYFEDPDPEQTTGAERTRRLELVLGLCLLLVVVGVAGWDWWLGQSRLAAYRAGDLAAAERRWDEARSSFADAGDYSDAEARAADAVANIARRDKQLELSTTALARDDGPEALRALDALDQIEPGYGRSDLLRSRAQALVYRSALAGIVARRLEAVPPGLYYRTEHDWAWLEGSDALSSVRSTGPADYIVYDVPAAEDRSDASGNARAARRLMAARLDAGSFSFTRVALGPAKEIFWGHEGGWSHDHLCGGPPSPRLRSHYCVDGMTYSAAGSSNTTTVRLPGRNWTVLDLAPDGGGMLVADMGKQIGAQPEIGLYLAGPDGGRPGLLLRAAGWIERAAFSQDGRYVVTTLGFTVGAEGTSYQTLLLDTAGRAAPQVLSLVNYYSVEAPAGVDFVILSGTGSGKVAIAQHSAGQTMLRLVDLNSEQKQARTFWAGPQARQPMMVTRTHNGGVLVCAQTDQVSITLDPFSTDSGECVLIDGEEDVTSFPLPQAARYGIGYAWPRVGSVIYPAAWPAGSAFRISVLHIVASASPSGSASSTVILQLPLGAGERLNLAPGQGMLAYARQGQLHARSYDGSFDLVLEVGVDAIFDVHGAADIASLF